MTRSTHIPIHYIPSVHRTSINFPSNSGKRPFILYKLLTRGCMQIIREQINYSKY
ncbi:MAG: hypothetical protein P857_1046 [Candidatus Xenolissoclinum pacificiensis L6]|uniref:Uncharacterized protein n=1 Tax=Candidatus Xenolissoclinum pacificiensis L6 TaxID=1401685 RepID=W2V2I3_9RICK|nr:MAG: hypothetical protein P857_1046 [Candidatus Xenolissoclinum pacificiensis L6]